MDFAGYPTGRIDNGLLRIDYMRHGSLRLVRLFYADNDQNLFIELPNAGWETPNGYYKLFGGHRLWVSPEVVEVTYLPEPEDLFEESIPGGVRLTQHTDPRSGVQKIMEIHMVQGEASFTIKHTLVNHGDGEVRGAAWALSQLRIGGIAVLPQPKTKADVSGLLPNRSLALWPYTRLNDPRLRWMDNFLMIRTDPLEHPCKIGCYGPEGWEAYYLDGVLIRKRIDVQPWRPYPDFNSALEIYVNDRFIELESLSPLMQLKPGDKLIHEERWNLEKVEGLNSEEALANYLENANSG